MKTIFLNLKFFSICLLNLPAKPQFGKKKKSFPFSVLLWFFSARNVSKALKVKLSASAMGRISHNDDVFMARSLFERECRHHHDHPHHHPPPPPGIHKSSSWSYSAEMFHMGRFCSFTQFCVVSYESSLQNEIKFGQSAQWRHHTMHNKSALDKSEVFIVKEELHHSVILIHNS